MLAGAAHGGVANGRHVAGFHARLHARERRLNPSVVAGVWDDLGAEFNPIIKSVEIHAAVGIYKVAGVADTKAILAQQPLVHFHLPFVANLPR